MADDGNSLLHNLIASQLLAGGLHSLAKNLMKGTDMPVPSNWLMHLVTVGRDVLGITGFNFQDKPVTPHTSFVNSLQEVPNYYLPPSSDYLQLPGGFDISELESPIKHYLQADDLQPSKSTNRQINFSKISTQSQKYYPPPLYGKGLGGELFWTNPSVPGPGKMMSDGTGPGKLMSDGTGPGKLMSDGTGPGKLMSESTGPGKLMSESTGPGKLMSDSTGPGKMMSESITDYPPSQMPSVEEQISENFVDQNHPLRIINSNNVSDSNVLKLDIKNVIDSLEHDSVSPPSSQEEIDNLSNKLSIVDTEIREEIDKIASTKSLLSDLTMIGSEGLTDNNASDSVIDVIDLGKTEILRSEHLTPQSEHLTPQICFPKICFPQSKDLTPQSRHLTPQSEHLTPQSEHLTPQSEHLTPLESVSMLEEGTPLLVQIQNLQDLLTNASSKKSKNGKSKTAPKKRGRKKKISAIEESNKSDDTGETELLTELQRLLTSNIMSTDTTKAKPPPKKRGRKRRDPSPLTVLPNMEHSQYFFSPESLAGPATSSKLFTELHRLLTQSSIRSAIQDDKQNRIRDQSPTRVSHPTSTSPPYIQAPQAYDHSSQDATNLSELYKADGDKKLFICPQCNKEFKTQQCLKRHIGRHLGVKPYPCLFCKKRFNDKANMHRHEKTHLNERSFVCDVCDEKFFRKEVLQMHVRAKHAIASDIINCKFKNCSFTCKVPSVLVEHIQTLHFNNYRYSCEHCKYKTSYSSNYKKHLRVHSGERPYKCKSCGKEFKQANALRMHNRIHVDRPHRCAICLKTFAVEVGLRIHYEHNHGPKAAQKGQKKAFEKQKKEIVKKYREQRNVHSKKLSFVNVMPTKL